MALGHSEVNPWCQVHIAVGHGKSVPPKRPFRLSQRPFRSLQWPFRPSRRPFRRSWRPNRPSRRFRRHRCTVAYSDMEITRSSTSHIVSCPRSQSCIHFRCISFSHKCKSILLLYTQQFVGWNNLQALNFCKASLGACLISFIAHFA